MTSMVLSQDGWLTVIVFGLSVSFLVIKLPRAPDPKGAFLGDWHTFWHEVLFRIIMYLCLWRCTLDCLMVIYILDSFNLSVE